MSNYIREYICTECFLLYDWPFPDEAGGRKPCLHCGASPMGADDFAAAYWERQMVEENGADFFKGKYWYVPQYVSLARAEHWATKDRRRVDRLPEKPDQTKGSGVKE